MRLTPGQVAELRSESNVRGCTIDGNIVVPMYRVAVSMTAFTRLQTLTQAQAMPRGMSWYVLTSNPDRVELAATQPEFLAEMENQIDAARRPPQF